MIQFSAPTSLESVAAREWDALVGDGSFYLSHSWFRTQDAGQPVDPVYLLARSRGRLVGALPVYDVQKETNDFYLPARCADGRWHGRYLLAGARRAYANGLLLDRDLSAAARAETAEGLLARLREHAGTSGSSGALFLYAATPAARTLADVLPAARPVLTSAEAVLDLPGAGLDDYLRMLPRRKRVAVRHEIDTFAGAGLTVGTEPAALAWEEMSPLLGNLQRRYGSDAPDEHWRQLLRRQAAELSGPAVVFTCRHQGKLLGASLGYDWHGTLYMKLCGFDYANLNNNFEYFNLAYYAPIAYAYARGLRRVHFGREALEAKLHRGARLCPLWSIEIPAPGFPPPRPAGEWNRATAARWRDQFARSPGRFGDPGWSLWGCGPGESHV